MERRYLVANKIDLIDKRKVDEEQGQRVKIKYLIILIYFLYLVR
jgi:hypothetical protein